MSQQFYDLDRHRTASLVNGVCYYDASGKLLGTVREDQWKWDNLTMDIKDQILKYVSVYSMETDTPLTITRIFTAMLTAFNIACPHPTELRNYKEYHEIKMASAGLENGQIKPYYYCEACEERVTIEPE